MARATSTLNPLTLLENAVQLRRPVRVTLRRHHEDHSVRYVEGWPLRLEDSPRGGRVVVVCGSPVDSPDAAHWVLHVDRIALVEMLSDSTPAPADR